MKEKALRFFTSGNMLIVYVILLFSAAVGIREPAFFGPATPINLCRSGIFTLCFALCEMLVMIGGGIDVSFPAIACVSLYVPMYLFAHGILPDSGILFLLAGLLCGAILGALNGLLTCFCRIPSLIATLATSSIASGGLAFFFGVKNYTAVPTALQRIYGMNLLTYRDAGTGISYPLTVLIAVPVLLCVLIALFLRCTMAGRGLYAMGGNPGAARIVGFPVGRLQFFTYVISGTLTGLTAVLYVTLMQNASTTAFMGDEMLVIAACVVGGCSLSGGRGGVSGVVLGTLLITLVQNYLNMLGIDTRWQTFAVGVVLLFGVLMTALQSKWQERLPKRRSGI